MTSRQKFQSVFWLLILAAILAYFYITPSLISALIVCAALFVAHFIPIIAPNRKAVVERSQQPLKLYQSPIPYLLTMIALYLTFQIFY